MDQLNTTKCNVVHSLLYIYSDLVVSFCLKISKNARKQATFVLIQENILRAENCTFEIFVLK